MKGVKKIPVQAFPSANSVPVAVCGQVQNRKSHLEKLPAVDSVRQCHGRMINERDIGNPVPGRSMCPRRRCCGPTGSPIASPEWLFPAPTRRGLKHSLANNGGPVTRSSLQSAFRRALKKSGIAKRAHVHTLRHSYAAITASQKSRIAHTVSTPVAGSTVQSVIDAAYTSEISAGCCSSSPLTRSVGTRMERSSRLELNG